MKKLLLLCGAWSRGHEHTNRVLMLVHRSETPDAPARSDRRTSERTQGSVACVNRTSLVQFWSPLEQREREKGPAHLKRACVGM